MRFRLLGLFLSVIVVAPLFASDPPAARERPRLAVLVYVDQLRGDYLTRWEGLFEAGLQRLTTDGAWFQNCHYPYATTVTGAGHASVATGTSPDRHGIIANEWYDRAAGVEVYCATTSRYTRVPPAVKVAVDETEKAETKSLVKKERGAGSPDRLLVPTIGDALKEGTGGKGKVVALSFKDRACVLPAGHRPDACYWFDGATGTVVTSTYYRDRPHAWVEAFNAAGPADRWFGRTWERLRPTLDYRRYSSVDDLPGEGKGTAQGRTFPHPLTGGLTAPGSKFYAAFYNSPFGNEVLFELVKRAVEAEQLGQDDIPDLLSVSFSSNDPVGHSWGPDSQEVLDITLRTDLLLGRLLAYLDERVGKGKYALVLSADHGICPLPEVSRAQGKDANRVGSALVKAKAEEFLRATYGVLDSKARWLETTTVPWLYLNRNLIRERGLKQADVEEALAAWLAKQPGVLAAYPRGRLTNGLFTGDPLAERVRRSFHPERSGDVAVVLKPYYLLSDPLGTGTHHGSPHAYDTHVPLLVYGPGVRGGVRQEAVTPQAAAAILAHFLGIKPPAAAEAPVPASLLK